MMDKILAYIVMVEGGKNPPKKVVANTRLSYVVPNLLSFAGEGGLNTMIESLKS